MDYLEISELYHHGILGQKWGIRRYQNEDGSLTSAGKKRYHASSLKNYIAKKDNEKIDESFDIWKKNAALKKEAIEEGKKANKLKLEYLNDPTEENKNNYNEQQKLYKSKLKKNTTYRIGAVRSEVDYDMSKRYLSLAKKVKKELEKDPNNKELNRVYNKYMNEYGSYRYQARRDEMVGQKRSQTKANVKRYITNTVKATAVSAGVLAGVLAVNEILNKKGSGMTIDYQTGRTVADFGKKIINAGKSFVSFLY